LSGSFLEIREEECNTLADDSLRVIGLEMASPDPAASQVKPAVEIFFGRKNARIMGKYMALVSETAVCKGLGGDCVEWYV
jgi:hypothetical protein